NKLRAVGAFMPSIQRLEGVTRYLMAAGLGLLTVGLIAGLLYLKEARGSYVSGDPFVLYCGFTWIVYLVLFISHSRFAHHGRRLAWGAVVAFAFVMLTFWGVWLLSGLHNPHSNPANLSSTGPVSSPVAIRAR